MGLFCEQAKLDEDLRNMKIWFESVHSREKFSKLASLLQKANCSVSEKEVRSIFKVEESENNPFFTIQDFDGSYDGLVKAYTEAAAHWNDNIRNRFDQ